jgi:hypothetical protein
MNNNNNNNILLTAIGLSPGGSGHLSGSGHLNVVRLSALCTGRLYPQDIFLSQTKGHNADGKIMSMKNSSGTIGNRTQAIKISKKGKCVNENPVAIS